MAKPSKLDRAKAAARAATKRASSALSTAQKKLTDTRKQAKQLPAAERAMCRYEGAAGAMVAGAADGVIGPVFKFVPPSVFGIAGLFAAGYAMKQDDMIRIADGALHGLEYSIANDLASAFFGSAE